MRRIVPHDMLLPTVQPVNPGVLPSTESALPNLVSGVTPQSLTPSTAVAQRRRQYRRTTPYYTKIKHGEKHLLNSHSSAICSCDSSHYICRVQVCASATDWRRSGVVYAQLISCMTSPGAMQRSSAVNLARAFSQRSPAANGISFSALAGDVQLS